MRTLVDAAIRAISVVAAITTLVVFLVLRLV